MCGRRGFVTAQFYNNLKMNLILIALMLLIAPTTTAWNFDDLEREIYSKGNLKDRIQSPEERYELWKQFAIDRKRSSAKWFDSPEFAFQNLLARFPDVTITQRDSDLIAFDICGYLPRYFTPTFIYAGKKDKKRYGVVKLSYKRKGPSDNLFGTLSNSLAELFEAYVAGPRQMTRFRDGGDVYVSGMHSIMGSIYLSLDGDKDRTLRVFGLILNDYGLYQEMDAKFQVLKNLIFAHFPKLGKHLFTDLEMEVEAFAAKWFLALFQSDYLLFPDTRIRILDGFLQHGWRMIYSFALSILQHMYDPLMECQEKIFAEAALTRTFKKIFPHTRILASAFVYLGNIQDTTELEHKYQESLADVLVKRLRTSLCLDRIKYHF